MTGVVFQMGIEATNDIQLDYILYRHLHVMIIVYVYEYVYVYSSGWSNRPIRDLHGQVFTTRFPPTLNVRGRALGHEHRERRNWDLFGIPYVRCSCSVHKFSRFQ